MLIFSIYNIKYLLYLRFKNNKILYSVSWILKPLLLCPGRGLWGSMVGLNQAIQQAVMAASSPTSPDAIDSALRRVELAHQMNIALQRHRTTFVTLLHKPKSQADRFVSSLVYVCIILRCLSKLVIYMLHTCQSLE